MAFANLKKTNKALKSKQFLIRAKNVMKKLFNDVSDLTITDLSIIPEQRAVEYMDRIDLSKIYTIKILRTSVKHNNSKVVIKGINILKQVRTIDSKKAICTALTSKELNVVLEAIEALTHFANHNVEKSLANCLTRKNKQIATAALWALAELKTPQSILAIESVLEGNDEELAKTALWILKGSKSYRSGKKLRA